MQTENLSAGVPVGNQVLGCLLHCPKTPHNQYGALPWGPPGTLGPAKSKIPRISPIPGSPKKTQVKNTQNPQKVKTSKIRKNEAVSSNISAQDHMTNLLRLTGELGNFRILDRWAGDMAKSKRVDVNRGWYRKGIPSR